MPKRVTKATAKSLVRRHCSSIGADRIEIDSDKIVLWFAGEGIDHHDGCDQVEAASDAIAAELPSCNISTRGSHVAIFYKPSRLPQPMGDWNDKASRHHY
ncbi:MAG: hypothetical protein ACTSX8_03170 [Alphaproteobacteria bacterium]